MTDTLTRAERRRLRELEQTIARGLETFIEVGRALMEIRTAKLYRQSHGSWEAYCRDRWGFTARRALQLIRAAEIGTTVPVANEAQARAFPTAGDARVLRAIWGKATELAKHQDSPVTAAIISEAGRIRWRELEDDAKGGGFRMKFSPRGSYNGPPKTTPLARLPAAIAASERAKVESDRIREAAGLPPVPESARVAAWRRRLAENGNGSGRPDIAKIIAAVERLRESLPADSATYAALTKALEALAEAAGGTDAEELPTANSNCSIIGPPVAKILGHLTDAEFEAGVRALAPPPVGAPAEPCHCEGGPLVDDTDAGLGPWCAKCGRWVCRG